MITKYQIQRSKNMLLIIVVLPIVLAVFMLAFLVNQSAGIPTPIKDTNGKPIEGSMSEKVFVNIGGIQQGMFIRSKNSSKPVLLFLHGGPGFPNYFLFEKYQPGLEDYFTVCYWEQRGCGLSYYSGMEKESVNLEQLTADALELSRYLCKQFGKEKIYIMAWSGGTTIALPAVARDPSLFHAYIAIGQITNQPVSERIAFKYMLSEFKKTNQQNALRTLKKYRNLESDADLISFYNSAARDNYMHQLGIGTMRNMKSILSGIFIPVWKCNAYTFQEKFKIWKSKLVFIPKTNVKNQTLAIDFGAMYRTLEIPFYCISGKHDYTVNYELTRNYFDQLNAPLKGFYTFENAAHGPLFEDTDHFRKIIESDILNLKTSLADPREEN